jgi:adenylylsulfate kinase
MFNSGIAFMAHHQMTQSPIDKAAFAVWITGLPASGKSTIVRELLPMLNELGVVVEVLESDQVRRTLTPHASYSEEERDLFYRALAFIGARLTAHGVTVIFDATAGRRAYRDFARELIPRFAEVVAECPLPVCMARDTKGTYKKGQRGQSTTVPGLQSPYERPLNPDVTIDTTTTAPNDAAREILSFIKRRFL